MSLLGNFARRGGSRDAVRETPLAAALTTLALLVACAREGKPVLSPPSGPVRSSTPASAEAAPALDAGPSAATLPEEAADLSACALPVAAAPKPRSCAPFEARTLAGVESELRHRFKPSSPQNKVVVDFGCYGIDDSDVREIVFETGNGHGGSLELTRWVRAGERFVVRQIRWSEYRDRGMVLRSATVPAAALEPQLRRMAASLMATVHEIPVYVEGMGLGLSGTSSSYDYHSGLTLLDGAGHDVERHYSGYATDSAEELPMELATRSLRAILAKATFEEDPARDADRLFFAQRFLRMEAGAQPFWWVEERFLGMASVLGSRPLLPALMRVAKKPAIGGGTERRKAAAMAAIGAILSLDAAKVAPGEVLRKAEAACRK